jgi:hypothetical protein
LSREHALSHEHALSPQFTTSREIRRWVKMTFCALLVSSSHILSSLAYKYIALSKVNLDSLDQS